MARKQRRSKQPQQPRRKQSGGRPPGNSRFFKWVSLLLANYPALKALIGDAAHLAQSLPWS